MNEQFEKKINESELREVKLDRGPLLQRKNAAWEIKEDLIRRNDVLDKIKAEIEKAVREDIFVSLDGTDEVRIPRLDPDDVFEIIDKYKAEVRDKE